MVTNELMKLGAVDTAALIAGGQLSALEVTEARISRIEQQHARLNALVVRRFDEARQEARALDARRSRDEALPPLAGVPLTVKETLDVAGLPSTGGLPSRRDHRAETDCDAVARLRQAGAIVLGKSNVAQALIYAESDNPLYGRSHHPDDPERSCGGSSGGEAALVASGGSALGIGTDIGGSVRIPAAFCGVAGLKPTAGRLPDPQRLSVPVGELAIASQLGPLAHNVADVEAALRVMNPPQFTLDASTTVDVSKLRVGVYEHDGLFAPSPGVRRAVREAAAALRAAGATVVNFSVPDADEVNALFYALLGGDGTAGLKRLIGSDRKDPRAAQLLFLGARSRTARHGLAALAAAAGQRHAPALLRAFGACSVDRYWRLCERQIDYRARFVCAMDRSDAGALDLLLGPAVALPAFRHGATKDLGVPGVYTTLYNLLGFPAGVVPVTCVRAGEESDRPASRDMAERAAARSEAGSVGLPLSVQVAARPWRESAVLAAMGAIEAAARMRS